jgi:hypothetical protein
MPRDHASKADTNRALFYRDGVIDLTTVEEPGHLHETDMSMQPLLIGKHRAYFANYDPVYVISDQRLLAYAFRTGKQLYDKRLSFDEPRPGGNYYLVQEKEDEFIVQLSKGGTVRIFDGSTGSVVQSFSVSFDGIFNFSSIPNSGKFTLACKSFDKDAFSLILRFARKAGTSSFAIVGVGLLDWEDVPDGCDMLAAHPDRPLVASTQKGDPVPLIWTITYCAEPETLEWINKTLADGSAIDPDVLASLNCRQLLNPCPAA